jgi:aldehyde dehydrogenase (NAD+)
MLKTHKNYINGEWVDASGDALYKHQDPADLSSVTGVFKKSTVEDTIQAVAAAKAAFEAWANLSVQQRAEYLKKVHVLMRERIEPIAKIITMENGKTLKESRGEMLSAVNEMEFQINQGLRMPGEIVNSSIPGVMAYQIRRPIGPVAIISPWNFPFNVPARKITPALISGNTCILKPALLTSATGVEFVKLFHDAGVPKGVINLVIGSGSVVGEELVRNKDIKAVTFTGSTEVGMAIHVSAAPGMKRTQLEMGGKNPLVILEDADMEAAVDAAALAAFACAGQWCISTSRIIVQRSVLDEFTEKILEKSKKIIVGRGDDSSSTMGPVCGEIQLKNVLSGIKKAKEEGAKLLTGGNQVKTAGLENGCFVEPTIFAGVTPDMSIAQEEIFGPVLAIMAVEDFDEAVELANNVDFGLGSSIYTRDIAKAMTFVNKTDVGLTHVNMHTAYKEPQLSFGGVKASGHGIPEAGKTGIEFFTEHKTVYINPGNYK